MKGFWLCFAVASFFFGCAETQETTNTNSVGNTAHSNATPKPKPAKPLESEFSDLSFEKCKKLDASKEPGAIMRAECPGIGGFKVITAASDHSQALEIVDPRGKASPLDLRAAINSSSDFILGDKIEWRSEGKGNQAKPAAAIVRLNLFKTPERQEKQESYLLVVRLAVDSLCITDAVPTTVAKQANKARELADSSAERPCITGK